MKQKLTDDDIIKIRKIRNYRKSKILKNGKIIWIRKYTVAQLAIKFKVSMIFIKKILSDERRVDAKATPDPKPFGEYTWNGKIKE